MLQGLVHPRSGAPPLRRAPLLPSAGTPAPRRSPPNLPRSLLLLLGVVLAQLGQLPPRHPHLLAQHRQLQEARQRDCEHADLLTGQARRAPRGAGAFEAAIQGRQVAVERNEGAGSVGAEMLESDPHSPASWVLFLCWAQEQVRGSRWVLVEDAVDMFARQDPRFLPLLLPS